MPLFETQSSSEVRILMNDNWQDKSLLEKIDFGYEKAWQTFIMPHKYEYGSDSLGCPIFRVDDCDTFLKRQDFSIQTKRGFHLECSLFVPSNLEPTAAKTCVIYLHSQSGNRIEGLFLREYCTRNNFYLLLFDFSGCGLSEGQYVSLGHYEKDDLQQVAGTNAGDRHRATRSPGRPRGALGQVDGSCDGHLIR